jgi:hypothetical protein
MEETATRAFLLVKRLSAILLKEAECRTRWEREVGVPTLEAFGEAI